MTNWKIGDQIGGKWEVYKILSGGMGVVYIAIDEDIGIFALKTFQDEIFKLNSDIVYRFNQEAFAWMNLDVHQNVVRALLVETIEGKPYLAMEYVNGGDLSTWVGTPRLTNNLPQVLKFGIQLCDGMDHAVSKGIKAHRDLKPQNCLITDDHTLKISDFGLARIVDGLPVPISEDSRSGAVDLNLSRTGTAAGTCTHMAPEQFLDAKNVDVRADIYSFGVMLFQMVTGKLPFYGNTFKDFEYKHRTQTPPRLGSTSPMLDRIVEKCLAKDPAERYGSFYQCRADLVTIYEELTQQAAPQPLTGPALGAVELALKAQSFCTLGRLADSLNCSEQALQINPATVVAWNSKGMALSGLKRYAEALDCFDRALQIDPREAIALTNKGHVLMYLQRIEEALEFCNKALECDPEIALCWNNKAMCLLEMGRFEEAESCIERALELNPRFEMTLYNKGVLHDKSGERQEAIQWYQRSLAINPRWWQAWNNLANAFNDFEQFEEALACLEQAFKCNIDSEELWINKARALICLERFEEAIISCDKALELNPTDTRAWTNRALALGTLGRHDEARKCFDKALDINPRETRVWFGRGTLLLDLNQPEEALNCFDREIELNPNWDVVWCFKGETLAKLDREEEALRCFEKALTANPNNADAWYVKGRILSQQDKLEEAIECFERTIKLKTSLPEPWFNLGLVLARSGRVSLAMECLEEAGSLGHPGAEQAISILQEALQDDLSA